MCRLSFLNRTIFISNSKSSPFEKTMSGCVNVCIYGVSFFLFALVDVRLLYLSLSVFSSSVMKERRIIFNDWLSNKQLIYDSINNGSWLSRARASRSTESFGVEAFSWPQGTKYEPSTVNTWLINKFVIMISFRVFFIRALDFNRPLAFTCSWADQTPTICTSESMPGPTNDVMDSLISRLLHYQATRLSICYSADCSLHSLFW